MGALIRDEFAGRRDVSRQQVYQLRHRRDGLCMLCAEPAATKNHCRRHAVDERERQRRRVGSVRRNLRALTYRYAFF